MLYIVRPKLYWVLHLVGSDLSLGFSFAQYSCLVNPSLVVGRSFPLDVLVVVLGVQASCWLGGGCWWSHPSFVLSSNLSSEDILCIELLSVLESVDVSQPLVICYAFNSLPISLQDLENYILELIPTLPQLKCLEESFYSFYVCTAVRKFFFFLDPMRTGRYCSFQSFSRKRNQSPPSPFLFEVYDQLLCPRG